MGERGVRNAEVEGSIPFSSTNSFLSIFSTLLTQDKNRRQLGNKFPSPGCA
jgi:hypothetical protein